MKTACAAALFALVSLTPASAFDNQTCQTFLAGTWVGDDGNDNYLTMAVLLKGGKAVTGFGPAPSKPDQGVWHGRTWTAKPGSAPERCVLVTKMIRSDGVEAIQEQELSVIDDNMINIYNARMNFRRQ